LVLFVSELLSVAESFNEDESLVGTLLSNSLLEQLHDEVDIEVDGSVLHFIMFIDHAHLVEGGRKAALRAGLKKAFTELSVFVDVLSNQLVD